MVNNTYEKYDSRVFDLLVNQLVFSGKSLILFTVTGQMLCFSIACLHIILKIQTSITFNCC